MVGLDAIYPQYGFAAHKGYGTPDHCAALDRHGPCPIHRRSFEPVKIAAGILPAPEPRPVVVRAVRVARGRTRAVRVRAAGQGRRN
jgi:hypothetical protein